MEAALECTKLHPSHFNLFSIKRMKLEILKKSASGHFCRRVYARLLRVLNKCVMKLTHRCSVVNKQFHYLLFKTFTFNRIYTFVLIRT